MSEIGRANHVHINFTTNILIRQPAGVLIKSLASRIGLVEKSLLLLEHAEIVVYLHTTVLIHLRPGDDHLVKFFGAQRQLSVPFLPI